jgi:hypothetical protein
MKQECARGALSRLRKPLGRQDSQREPGVNHMVRQVRSGKETFPDDGVEPDRPGERYALIEIVERPPVVQIGNMYDVTSLSDLFREREYTGCKALRMMKQQQFGHR